MVKKIIRLLALFLLVTFVAGITVYLTFVFLVGSEETVVVPDIVGQNVADGLELLTDLGLGCKVDGSEYSPTVPKHHVIWQHPEPGGRIKKGRNIEIVISKGKEEILMPDIRGMTIEQAGMVLEENGLAQGVVSQTYSDKYENRSVVAQYPRPGRMVARDGQVDLLVSLGKRPVAYVMPDMRGMTIEDAVSLMDGLGLLPGKIRYKPTDGALANTVTEQQPCPGCMAVEGSRVNLTVNRSRGESIDRILHRDSGVRLFSYRLANGFLNRHINVKLNFMGGSLDVVDEYMKPGTELWVAVPAHMDATVFLYEDGELVGTRMFEGW